MNARGRTQEPKRLGWTALVIIAAIVVFAGLCLLGLFLRSISYPPAGTMHWLAYCGSVAVAVVVLVVILHGMHETRATRRFVAELLPLGPHAPPESVKRFRAEAVCSIPTLLPSTKSVLPTASLSSP